MYIKRRVRYSPKVGKKSTSTIWTQTESDMDGQKESKSDVD